MFKLLKSEQGQTIGLFPIISIVLIVAIFFVYNIGDYYYSYVREQNAIDAAVYSGAAMQADALDLIVDINKILLVIYGLSIVVCLVGIVAAYFLGPEVASGACEGAQLGFLGVEAAAKATLTMLNDATPTLSAAAMKIYTDNGGQGMPIIYVSTLKLEKIIWKNFLMPSPNIASIPPYFTKHDTFMGMVEQQHDGDGVYSWCRGQFDDTSKVHGSFGVRQNNDLSDSGLYATDGPLAVGYAKSTFTPKTSWFSKYSKPIIVAAEARPYGGSVETTSSAGKTDHSAQQSKTTTDSKGKKTTKTKSSSYPAPSDHQIPWGCADFKAKLVPVGY